MSYVTFSQKSLLIFDLDGTLIDSVPDLAMAVDNMLGHFDTPPAGVERVRTWIGNGSLKLVERALTWANLATDALPHAHQIFLSEYANCHGGTVAYQGVSDGLTRLRQHGYTLALCTNKPSQFLPAILDDFGWADKFACVVGGDTLSTKKPDPAPLYHICQKLGFKTDQAIMIGDSTNDIQAGKNAQITTLALTYGYNYGKPITDDQPDGVFDSFGVLVDFLVNE